MCIRKIFPIVILLCIIFSCGEKKETIDIYIKGIRFTVECARTREEQRMGLMYRKKLAPKSGMIFIYTNYVQTSFWMQNTYIPLSIAFISKEGEILDIKNMTPLSTDLVKSRFPYMYALEVNQGAFEEIGVRPGDYVVFPRGFK
jgi:uncharacterized membrane protein (UPF0127 family)